MGAIGRFISEARRKRDEDMARAERNAAPYFNVVAERIVRLLSREREEFTTDAVWHVLERIGVDTHEHRALGPVMMKLSRRGVIEKTGRQSQSIRKECNARPLTVWRRATKGS